MDAFDDDRWSEFHDLMHRPLGRWCWTMPGGPARHLALWFRYQGLQSVWARRLCPTGRHWWMRGRYEDGPSGRLCIACLHWRPFGG